MSLCLAVNVSDGLDVGGILRTVLLKHEVSHKAAWIDCEMDGASFCRALVGQQPLDLWKLRKLDARVFVDFLTALAMAAVHQWFSDLQLPLQMVKADPRGADQKTERSA